MRRRQSLVIRRDDHRRDALGAIFLGAVTDEAEMRAYLERYLGASVSVKSVRLEHDVLHVIVESLGFALESRNLVMLGRALLDRGRVRSAVDMFEEALRLDTLNFDALKGDAAARMAQDDVVGAEERWVRAGEVGGYDGEILRGLAAVALRLDRRASAMRYLSEALVVSPEDTASRALLADLERQVELAFVDAEDEESGRKR